MIAPIRDLAVYVHIPFCSSRCHYCAFYFETGWSPRVLKSTLDASIEEARSMYAILGRPRVRTLYFGGGTPSVIPPQELAAWLEKLFSVLDISETRPVFELDFEANPESVGPELLDVLRNGAKGRVRSLRLSLGVQSFDDNNLATLGRRARRGDIDCALEVIDSYRATANSGDTPALKLNLDLIYGIPGRTSGSLLQDLRLTADRRPDGISLYELTVEDGTPLEWKISAGRLTAPDRNHSDTAWQKALAFLEDRGYRNYEVSNFALPGRESMHNFAYWRLQPYLGIGPGAVSSFPSVRTPGGLIRLENPDIFAYPAELRKLSERGLAGRTGAKSGVEYISPREQFIEMFITGLRTIAGVSDADLHRRFGDAGKQAAGQLRLLWKDHLLPRSGRIILKDSMRYTMDVLLKDVLRISEAIPAGD